MLADAVAALTEAGWQFGQPGVSTSFAPPVGKAYWLVRGRVRTACTLISGQAVGCRPLQCHVFVHVVCVIPAHPNPSIGM